MEEEVVVVEVVEVEVEVMHCSDGGDVSVSALPLRLLVSCVF